MSKNVLIISGSSSIGETLINKFLSYDYKVISTYNKTSIKISNKNLSKIKLDIVNQKSQEKFIEKVSNINFSSIIFLTGIIIGKNYKDMNLSSIKKTFDINFIYPVYLLKKLLLTKKKIIKQRIVFLSSISSIQGSYDPFYASSKSSLNMFIKCLAKDNFLKKTSICGVAPSLIENSSMSKDMSKKNILKHIDKNPLKKLIKIEDLSDFVFEISNPDKWEHLNGSIIDYNGGI